MENALPELQVAAAFFAMSTCAVCHRPCAHEDERTGMPYPGGYVKAADAADPPSPICDECVQRHYPDRMLELRAARASVR